MKLKISILAIALSVALCSTGAVAANLDTAKIDEITGLKGKMDQQEGVYKVSFPRDDVPVSVDGWTMPPFMGLGSWAAFQGTNEDAMVMGDTVLFRDEVNPVMSVALENGLKVTALHNHFFFDEPNVFFMHIGGEGGAMRSPPPCAKCTTKSKKCGRQTRNRKSPSAPGPCPRRTRSRSRH